MSEISLEMIKKVILQYEKMIAESSDPKYLKSTLEYWKDREKDFDKKDSNGKKV